MPLRVAPQVEPFTEYSKRKQPVLAISNEYRRLYRDLERYTIGQISGRSYLIAGHRGSGKTMLVQKAIEDLLRNSQGRSERPVFVRLHGPDLLPPDPAKAPDSDSAKKPTDASSTPNQIAIAFSGNSPASVTTSQLSPDSAKGDDDLVNVLTQMMKCLFRDVTNEFRRCIRERISALPRGYRRQEFFELAAQLDLEMTECPSASRLRTFWSRFDALKQGVLFEKLSVTGPVPIPPRLHRAFDPAPEIYPPTDAGMQEILVLSFLSQAFQVVAGKIEEKQKQIEAVKDERSSSLSTAYAVKNLLARLAGLLAGGVVGAQVAAKSNNSVTAVLLGLLTGGAVSLSFSYSSKRSANREVSQESVFIRDRSVATLSSVLPLLISRLRSIGLAPIFVVDELDKVQNLESKMKMLVQHLKYLVTENSFSCFLTDRRYLSCLNRQANEVAYAREYTYFSDRLLILYEPKELRKFIIDSFEALPPGQDLKPEQLKSQQDKDKEDSEKIAYVILQRARLHPVDIRRHIDRVAARDSFSIADFPSPGYRFEILVQVAIEWLLDGEDVQTQIAGNPDSRQVIYDALYYVSRLWEDASSAEIRRVPGFRNFGENAQDKKPGLLLEEAIFSQYIESRVAAEEDSGRPQDPAQLPLQPDPPPKLSGTDFDLLFLKVRELLNLLCNPVNFYNEILASSRPNKPPIYILNEIPRDSLLEQQGNTSNYHWLYDVSGRYLQIREVNNVVGDVSAAIARINELARQLDSLGKGLGGLQTIADLKIIPRTPEWRVVKPAIDRLTPLVNRTSQEPYGKMSADRDNVVEFANTLPDFDANVKAALICAAIFAPEVSIPASLDGNPPETAQIARLSAALVRISELLQLSTSREDDLRKMNSVLRSYHANSPVNTSHAWPVIINFVRQSMKKTTGIEKAPIIDSAWEICKTRFTQQFHEGAVQFEPQFEDVFTSIHAIGPGSALPFDLSTTTAAAWTRLLLRSLEDALVKVPGWLRTAAALELGFVDLGEKLARTVSSDHVLLSQWVRDCRLRLAAQNTSQRNVLVLSAESSSITENWPPSPRTRALVSTFADFARLLDCLKKNDIVRPADLPIHATRIELSGDRVQLGTLITQKPATIAALSNPKSPSRASQMITKDLEAFLNLEDFAYFTAESPITPLGTSSAPQALVVVAPRDLDELLDGSSSIRKPTTNAP